MNSNYDSTEDTKKHIVLVSNYLQDFASDLVKRGADHDSSKLESPEKELFDEMTPILENLEYNSPEYKESLEKLKPALDHHYANNSHHPQFYVTGVDGMNLLDIVEMFYDWKAATVRAKNGDIRKSIIANKERFKMSDQLVQIFMNTVNDHNW